MRVISRKKLREFWQEHQEAEKSLQDWFKRSSKARWATFADVRATIASADQVGRLTVFDIGGNKYRLIAFLDFKRGRVYVRSVLTHKDYDKEEWKKDEFASPPKKKRPKGKS